jgi:hypothetical protein
MSGIDWRWLLYGAAFVLIPFSSLFLVGLYVLKMTPKRWWQSVWSGTPPEKYDGKEPYDKWAKKMETARAIQRDEDDV